MTKNWQTRLNETWHFIDTYHPRFPMGPVNALKAYHNKLTEEQRRGVSLAMGQGEYLVATPRQIEKDRRHWRRALILVLMARLNSGSPENDLLHAQRALSENMNDIEAERRVKAELINLTEVIFLCRRFIDDHSWSGWDKTKQRPLLVGCSIGRRGTGGTGTLGCFVTDVAGDVFILTNRHVLQQKGLVSEQGWIESEVIQPAHQLGGTYFDVVAQVSKFRVTHDAAIARVKPGIVCRNVTPEGIHITGSNVAVEGGAITKRGCATRDRRGIVTNVAAPNMQYDITQHEIAGGYLLQDQLLIELDVTRDRQPTTSFRISGDSGSVALNEANEVVALMHGGRGKNVACGTHIGPILRYFGVRVLVGEATN